uniref:Uncharacterized protein n=1 Tax=Anguilla anguilla TaxID=7936 RepID=A0A0E9S4W5_ANGAN
MTTQSTLTPVLRSQRNLFTFSNC